MQLLQGQHGCPHPHAVLGPVQACLVRLPACTLLASSCPSTSLRHVRLACTSDARPSTQILTHEPHSRMQAAAMAGARAQPLLWLRLAQACLGSVHRARGCWQATASPDSSQGEAEAQQLMFAGCCLQNVRLLLDRPPPERSGTAAEHQQQQQQSPAVQWYVAWRSDVHEKDAIWSEWTTWLLWWRPELRRSNLAQSRGSAVVDWDVCAMCSLV